MGGVFSNIRDTVDDHLGWVYKKYDKDETVHAETGTGTTPDALDSPPEPFSLSAGWENHRGAFTAEEAKAYQYHMHG